ncbi:MAG: hypothetical protein WKF59_11495 [Chitinophagaceae bacterium]
MGTTEGFTGASATGGVSYVIPIDALKGTNGMEPKISLTYNSQGNRRDSRGLAGIYRHILLLAGKVSGSIIMVKILL